MQKSDLEMEVDLSSLGTFSTAMAAMFSKLGVPIKTAVPPMVNTFTTPSPWPLKYL